MSTVVVTLRTGEERLVVGRPGQSVMEAIRDGGIDEILAICGGCCSCATCHVHVDAADYDRLQPPASGESELLDFSDHRTDFSRLSCQLKIGAIPEGLRVTIAPED